MSSLSGPNVWRHAKRWGNKPLGALGGEAPGANLPAGYNPLLSSKMCIIRWLPFLYTFFSDFQFLANLAKVWNDTSVVVTFAKGMFFFYQVNDLDMGNAVERLRKYESTTPSRWREEAEWRRANQAWLRRSQTVAMKMLDRMEEMHWTQQQVAGMLGCSQQYVSRMVKGSENLSLEMLSKIEDVMGVKVFALVLLP